jgi:hypothetical protein
MSNYLGDFFKNSTVYVYFHTFNSSGASVTMSGFALGDINVYKNGSMTQRASTNGFTLLDTDGTDLDGITGIQGFSIDLSDNSDSGFYASGNDYNVVISSVTIDSQAVSFLAATFSIENRNQGNKAICRGIVGAAASTTSIPTSTIVPAAAVNDQFKGRIVIFDKDTATANLRGQATDISASTSGGTLTVTALTTAPASGDTFGIY